MKICLVVAEDHWETVELSWLTIWFKEARQRDEQELKKKKNSEWWVKVNMCLSIFYR